MKFEYPLGATPIDQDEIEGLIPSHVTTQSQLNEWEAVNILKAENWLFSRKDNGNFLTIEFIKLLHEKMFDDTWRWAGQFRFTWGSQKLEAEGPLRKQYIDALREADKHNYVSLSEFVRT